MLISGVYKGCKRGDGEWPRAICRKDAGFSSVMCSKCSRLVYKRCSGIRGNLWDVAKLRHAVCVAKQAAIVILGKGQCWGLISDV